MNPALTLPENLVMVPFWQAMAVMGLLVLAIRHHHRTLAAAFAVAVALIGGFFLVGALLAGFAYVPTWLAVALGSGAVLLVGRQARRLTRRLISRRAPAPLKILR